MTKDKTVWRPLHHGLGGVYPKGTVVHLLLVDKDNKRNTTTPCGIVWGRLISGKKGEVTCLKCIHAAGWMYIDWTA